MTHQQTGRPLAFGNPQCPFCRVHYQISQGCDCSGMKTHRELVRDMFAEITSKATPYGSLNDGSESDEVIAYIVPKGCIHRMAGQIGFQMFDGERHLTRAVAAATEFKWFVSQIIDGISAGNIKIESPTSDETLANILARGRAALSKNGVSR